MRQNRPCVFPTLIAAAQLVLAVGCRGGEQSDTTATGGQVDPASSGNSSEAPSDPPGPFDAELLRIARDYDSWMRVSDEAHWSPFDCVAPRPSGVLPSRSAEPSPHGRKLYYLFAKDPQVYRELDVFEVLDAHEQDDMKRRLIGQALVKESWKPVEVAPADVPKLESPGITARSIPDDFVIDGEHAFRAGDQADLFVMYKLDPSTPGTDEGWVYGTLTADGQRVTSAGRVESCMNCHATTGRDRLYGHPRMRADGARTGQASLRAYLEAKR